MPANSCNGLVHYLAGRFPGRLGWMISPGGWREPRPWLPYAIDNGKFADYSAKRKWREKSFFELLDRARLCKYKPAWVVVPDEIADKDGTMQLWTQYEVPLRRYRWPLAFAVQDGMTPGDVPKTADVVFVGGTTEWKWRNVERFCGEFPRVHVGRVNWVDKLEFCERIGAESCDGTGFFRGGADSVQGKQLADFIAGHRRCSLQPVFA